MVRSWLAAFVAIVLAALLAGKALAADRYALLVGVRQYDKTQLTNLQFSEADVTELAQVLQESGFQQERVVLMTQTAGASQARALPTAKRIRSELQLLLGRAEAGDTVLVAFAGHGVQFKGEQGAFFCPMDAALDDRETLIPLAEVYAALEKCPARTKVLLVDACRNEVATPTRRAVGGVELEAVGKPQAVKLPTGVASFFSCDAGQFAYEHPDLKHGVFFHFVLKGQRGEADLNRDQAIELTELDLFVRKAVKDFVAVELGQLQSPRLITTLDGAPVLVRIERPIGPPPLAVAPFDAATAKKHQADWASYLKVQPVTTNSVNMKLALIPPGEFLMGSPEGEKDRSESEMQHRVRITKPFYLGQTEVTIGQFRAFVTAENYKTEAERDGEGGWGYDAATDKFEGQKTKYTWKYTGFTMTDEHLVVNVTWNDAQAYCAWLTRKEGKTYRLPTEAEWEFACRAGTTSAYVHGNDREGLAQVGNVADGSAKAKFANWSRAITARDGYVFSAPVAQFRANGFGLYDMHGNVWEWCSDWYGAKYYDALAGRTTDDPQGDASEQKYRVLRGSSWGGDPGRARSAFRTRDTPDYRIYNLGFRVGRTP